MGTFGVEIKVWIKIKIIHMCASRYITQIYYLLFTEI